MRLRWPVLHPTVRQGVGTKKPLGRRAPGRSTRGGSDRTRRGCGGTEQLGLATDTQHEQRMSVRAASCTRTPHHRVPPHSRLPQLAAGQRARTTAVSARMWLPRPHQTPTRVKEATSKASVPPHTSQAGRHQGFGTPPERAENANSRAGGTCHRVRVSARVGCVKSHTSIAPRQGSATLGQRGCSTPTQRDTTRDTPA